MPYSSHTRCKLLFGPVLPRQVGAEAVAAQQHEAGSAVVNAIEAGDGIRVRSVFGVAQGVRDAAGFGQHSRVVEHRPAGGIIQMEVTLVRVRGAHAPG